MKHMVTKIESGERWSLTAFSAADGSTRRHAAAGPDLQEEGDEEPDDVEEDHEIPWVVRDGFVAPEKAAATEQQEPPGLLGAPRRKPLRGNVLRHEQAGPQETGD